MNNGRSRCNSPSCPLQYTHQSAERKKTRTKPCRSINEVTLRLRPVESGNSKPGPFARAGTPIPDASCIHAGAVAAFADTPARAIASNALHRDLLTRKSGRHQRQTQLLAQWSQFSFPIPSFLATGTIQGFPETVRAAGPLLVPRGPSRDLPDSSPKPIQGLGFRELQSPHVVSSKTSMAFSSH